MNTTQESKATFKKNLKFTKEREKVAKDINAKE